MSDYQARLNQQKAETDHEKARAAARWAIATLLWVIAAIGIGVLPAAIAAGWMWFL